MPTNSRPLIIGHRGASTHAPENTLAAFEMAIDAGADGIEFDVQLAKDVVPVVIHDETLLRTGRLQKRVRDLTSRELEQIDVGTWFNAKFPKRANRKFTGETVPTLQQTLRLLRGFDGLLYIELKCDETNFRELAAIVCEVICDSPQLPQVIVKSFKLSVIPEVRHRLPSVQTAALFAPEIMHYLRRREYMIALAREFGADQLSVHYSLITPRLCRLASAAEMPLTVWTVDDPKWIVRRRQLGIGALITNDPAKMLTFR